MTKKELVQFLSSKNVETDFLSKIKIAYRPFVCPFNEILKFFQENGFEIEIAYKKRMLYFPHFIIVARK